jgi:hypothetical protein
MANNLYGTMLMRLLLAGFAESAEGAGGRTLGETSTTSGDEFNGAQK